MGGLDWTFSTVTMWLANFVCIGLLLATQPASLNSLWAGGWRGDCRLSTGSID